MMFQGKHLCLKRVKGDNQLILLASDITWEIGAEKLLAFYNQLE